MLALMVSSDKQLLISPDSDMTHFAFFAQNRKCYVPRMRSKEELLMQVKFKKSWKGSGNQNTYFMEPPIMKPKILDPWTASRVQQPERAYTKFFASKFQFFDLKERHDDH